MADFTTWERDTLNRFAAEASQKLIENRREIFHLGLLLKRATAAEALASARLSETARKDASTELPNDDLCVLVAFEDGEVWPAFHDAGRWFYVTADPIVAHQVQHWRSMPTGPSRTSTPAAAGSTTPKDH